MSRVWFPVPRTALSDGGPPSSSPRSGAADQARVSSGERDRQDVPERSTGAAFPWSWHRIAGPGRSFPEFILAVGLGLFLLVGTMAAAEAQHDRFRDLDAGGGLLMVLAAGSTVLLRRRDPVRALSGTMLAVSTYMIVGYPYGPVQLCMVVSMFEVARLRAPRYSWQVCGLAALVASATVLPRLVREVGSPLLLALAWTAWIVLPWSLGSLVHVLSAARERSRRELVARVALEERMRIAGEVHDVAGHGFAVVAMQAGVAALVFDEHPEQARESLEAIQDTSTTSLTELRRMLDTIHPGESGSAPADPGSAVPLGESGPAGLSCLDELVEKVRVGGLPVRLDMPDPDLGVPGEIDRVAYQVVRESLTNVLRHAGPTEADVHVGRWGGELLVEVRDRGGTRHARPREGRGLRGMRRRVEAVGGRFEAGPRADVGFLVAARLPLTGNTR